MNATRLEPDRGARAPSCATALLGASLALVAACASADYAVFLPE